MNAISTVRSERVAQDSSALTDSRLAARCAETAQQAFFDYQTRFNAITERARERFLARDWAGSFDDAAERLHFYNDVLDGLTSRIRELMEVSLAGTQHLDGDQSCLLVANCSLSGVGNRGNIFQFVNPPRFCH